MEMNKEDEIALEESISDWKYKAAGGNVSRDCPLCTLNKRDCRSCIIYRRTGQSQCRGTPYWDCCCHELDYYRSEIAFLESLRPEKKVEKDIIEVGDKVKITEGSWAFGLANGKTRKACIAIGRVYKVVELNTCLPEGDDHNGKFGNDTILFEPVSGSYIFTREKYLRLAKPKHCPKCGKAK